MKWLAKIFTKRSNWSIPYFIFLLIFVVLPLVLIFIYACFRKARLPQFGKVDIPFMAEWQHKDIL